MYNSLIFQPRKQPQMVELEVVRIHKGEQQELLIRMRVYSQELNRYAYRGVHPIEDIWKGGSRSAKAFREAHARAPSPHSSITS